MNLNRLCTFFVAILGLLVFQMKSTLSAQIDACGESLAQETMSTNWVELKVRADGSLFWNGTHSGYRVPKVENQTSIHNGGIWLAGKDENEQVRTSALLWTSPGNDYRSGPIFNNAEEPNPNLCFDFDRVWSTSRTDVDLHESAWANGSYTVEQVPQSVRDWPGKDNPIFELFDFPENMELAPFHDRNGDGVYNPLDGDSPKIYGDQGFWSVFNDLTNHPQTNSEPTGVQVSLLAYAFEGEYSIDPVGFQTFYELTLENKTMGALSDFYFGIHISLGLGMFDDDAVGCISEENLGFGYNGDGFDDGYWGFGDEIPLVGIKYLQGLINGEGEDLGMSHFVNYDMDGGAPYHGGLPLNYHNAMQGIGLSGEPYNIGFSQEDPNYHFNANPADEDGTSMCALGFPPSEGYFVMSTGPVDFPQGEKQTIRFVVLWTPNVPHPCPDVTPLIELGNEMETFHEGVLAQSEWPLAIQNLSLKNSISLYPNPLQGNDIYFDYDSGLDLTDTELNVYDLSGRLMFKSELTATNKVSLPDLKTGIYNLIILRENIPLSSLKMVKL